MLSSPKDVTSDDKTMYGYFSNSSFPNSPKHCANVSRVAIRIFGFVAVTVVTIIRLLLFEYVSENNDDDALCAHWHALAPHKCIYASDAFQ